MSVQEVAAMLGLGEQTVRDYRNGFLLKHLARVTSKRPPGRPSKLTTAQRRELADVIKADPQAAGSPSGGGHTPRMQALLQRRFGVSDHPPSLATVLPNRGFSSQQARLVSEHLTETKRLEWCRCTWPRIGRHAQQRKALLRCGDAASFAPWGSLSSTWAPTGEQPAVPTSGTRKGDKVWGLSDYFSGPFFYTTHAGRFHSARSAAFVREVLSHTRPHVVVMHDGARYQTSQAMKRLFNAQAARLTSEPLPSYAPDVNPIEPRWKKVKKEATHLKHGPKCTSLQAAVDRALLPFAHTPREITVLLARYCETLSTMAA